MLSQSHVINGGTNDEAFQGQCFPRERGELLHAREPT